LVLTLWNHRSRQDQRYRGHALGPDQRRVSTGWAPGAARTRSARVSGSCPRPSCP